MHIHLFSIKSLVKTGCFSGLFQDFLQVDSSQKLWDAGSVDQVSINELRRVSKSLEELRPEQGFQIGIFSWDELPGKPPSDHRGIPLADAHGYLNAEAGFISFSQTSLWCFATPMTNEIGESIYDPSIGEAGEPIQRPRITPAEYRACVLTEESYESDRELPFDSLRGCENQSCLLPRRQAMVDCFLAAGQVVQRYPETLTLIWNDRRPQDSASPLVLWLSLVVELAHQGKLIGEQALPWTWWSWLPDQRECCTQVCDINREQLEGLDTTRRATSLVDPARASLQSIDLLLEDGKKPRASRGSTISQSRVPDRYGDWNICEDCLEPLAKKLWSVAHGLRKYFNVEKYDRAELEYSVIYAKCGYSKSGLSEADQARLDELSKKLQSQKQSSTAQDLERSYREYGAERAVEWLKINVSADYGGEFQTRLENLQNRFSALQFKACQIINGELGKKNTLRVRFAIQRLINRHYELLRELFPDNEDHPEREDLPADLCKFEVEILDEYEAIECEMREVSRYLGRVASLVRSKVHMSRQEQLVGTIDFQEAANSDLTHSGGKRKSVPPGNTIPREYAELRVWAMRELKGKQRRVIEMLIESDGITSISELAKDVAIDWEPPYVNSWNSIRQVLNKKLEKRDDQWRLGTHSNNATLSQNGQK